MGKCRVVSVDPKGNVKWALTVSDQIKVSWLVNVG